ncbi:MAG: RNA polymerase sigma factor [Clostridia bacterium]|nr:RNA polymerase sigma factor [Clostridia bacterium]
MSFSDKQKAECDKAIIEISQGNREALSVIYEHCAKMICSIARSILTYSDEVEDVLQETMISIVKSAKNYTPGTNPYAWVLSIARRRAKDILSKNPRKTTVSLDTEENRCFDDAFLESGSDLDTHMIIYDAMKVLSTEEQTVIELHYYYGFSYKEIASALGKNTAAVMQKCRRSVNKMRNYLEKGDSK